jgi:TctA family transporter
MEIDMENTKKMLTVILKCICFVVFVGLIIIGQRSVAYQGLYTMLAGLFGILFLLYLYNKKYR